MNNQKSEIVQATKTMAGFYIAWVIWKSLPVSVRLFIIVGCCVLWYIGGIKQQTIYFTKCYAADASSNLWIYVDKTGRQYYSDIDHEVVTDDPEERYDVDLDWYWGSWKWIRKTVRHRWSEKDVELYRR